MHIYILNNMLFSDLIKLYFDLSLWEKMEEQKLKIWVIFKMTRLCFSEIQCSLKKSIDFHSLKKRILLQVTMSCKWFFQFNKMDN